MFYSLHVVEPLRYDSVLIKETNEWMNECVTAGNKHLQMRDTLNRRAV